MPFDMQTISTPILKDLVLVGGGHSHLAVLRAFGMRPLAGLRLTLISPEFDTAYSGMLPGLVAGHYTFDETHIDLLRLCRFAGARFLRCRAEGIDAAGKTVLIEGRPPIPYDILSINSGSLPDVSQVPGAAAHAIPVKPVASFLARWRELESRLAAGGPIKIGIVGAGAGGVEIAMALRHRLRGQREVLLHLFEAGAEILPGHNISARRKIERELQRQAIALRLGQKVALVDGTGLVLSDGARFDLDAVIWTTHAAAPSWIAGSGLARDDAGFLLLDPSLRSLSHTEVFAAGDVGSIAGHARPKSGVFAVRQGPPLADNLRRALLERPLKRYLPQKRFLSLLATGGRSAVASRGTLAFEGPRLWRWKDWIDRRFMRRFGEDLPWAAMSTRPRGDDLPGLAALRQAAQQRCAGCGAKLAGDPLRRALARLPSTKAEDIALGLAAADDAAVLTPPPGRQLVQSVDFFPALLSDPYLFGRIAANHCLGDLFAMGAEPWTALALATLPFGPEEKSEEELFQMLAGATQVLAEAGAVLVGGHSSLGQELGLGFTVNGLAVPGEILRKGGLRPGDKLILTKPLGTGALFAAEMRGRAKGRWIEAAIAAMLRSNRVAAETLKSFGASAMTDVTGFGLAGHLGEMLEASGADVDLEPAALPMLEGARAVTAEGIESSLAPANRRRLAVLLGGATEWDQSDLALLADPQTAGGQLAGLPEEKAEACLEALRQSGDPEAAIIGRVEPRLGTAPSIRLF